jgi:hypothetical protein
MRTTIYGEDGWLLHKGAPIGGSGPEAPLRLNLADLEILASGFGVRDDDLWKRARQLELTECHRCDVASLPSTPRIL